MDKLRSGAAMQAESELRSGLAEIYLAVPSLLSTAAHSISTSIRDSWLTSASLFAS